MSMREKVRTRCPVPKANRINNFLISCWNVSELSGNQLAALFSTGVTFQVFEYFGQEGLSLKIPLENRVIVESEMDFDEFKATADLVVFKVP